jgi:hypothetical protein
MGSEASLKCCRARSIQPWWRWQRVGRRGPLADGLASEMDVCREHLLGYMPNDLAQSLLVAWGGPPASMLTCHRRADPLRETRHSLARETEGATDHCQIWPMCNHGRCCVRATAARRETISVTPCWLARAHRWLVRRSTTLTNSRRSVADLFTGTSPAELHMVGVLLGVEPHDGLPKAPPPLNL